MKLVEIKDQKNSSTLPTNTKKDYSDQALNRFTLYNTKKHIFKKKTRLTRKQKLPNNAKHDHGLKTKSSQDQRSRILPILQSKQSQTQMLSSALSQPDKIQPQCQLKHTDIQLAPQPQANKDEVGDVWTYISSIGEHLLKQQALLPMPVFEYSANFTHNDRMSYLQLILDFCLRYGFRVQTTFLAFNIYHRIAFAPQFQKYSNSVKATSCLFLAAKYEEIAIPRVQIFTRMDKSQNISAEQILTLESEFLLHFSFNLGFPTVLHFIDILRIHHNLDCFLRQKLIRICYSSLRSLSLWQNGGSLLALACLHLIHPQLELGRSKSEDFNKELKWRAQELRRLGIREAN